MAETDQIVFVSDKGVYVRQQYLTCTLIAYFRLTIYTAKTIGISFDYQGM